MYTKQFKLISLLCLLSFCSSELIAKKLEIHKQASPNKVKAEECEAAQFNWGWLNNKEGCRDDKNRLIEP